MISMGNINFQKYEKYIHKIDQDQKMQAKNKDNQLLDARTNTIFANLFYSLIDPLFYENMLRLL